MAGPDCRHETSTRPSTGGARGGDHRRPRRCGRRLRGGLPQRAFDPGRDRRRAVGADDPRRRAPDPVRPAGRMGVDPGPPDNFRATDRWVQWRAAIGPYFAQPPLVEHFDRRATERPAPRTHGRRAGARSGPGDRLQHVAIRVDEHGRDQSSAVDRPRARGLADPPAGRAPVGEERVDRDHVRRPEGQVSARWSPAGPPPARPAPALRPRRTRRPRRPLRPRPRGRGSPRSGPDPAGPARRRTTAWLVGRSETVTVT